MEKDYFNKSQTHKDLFATLGQKEVIVKEMRDLHKKHSSDLKVSKSQHDILLKKVNESEQKSNDVNLSDEERQKHFKSYQHNFKMLKNLQRHISISEELCGMLEVDGYLKEQK